ncbi:MAG: cobalt-zinc-cadmium efflux system protein [Actinomycetota bacterium]|nr:cobalt-zinc-cadmium efflux system protein [Actinomycetota bacterium]
MPDERSRRRERRLTIVLVLNVAIVAGEVIGGLASRSLGLLADAAHNLTDVAGVAFALVAVRWARRAPTERRSFGYHRGTVLAAQANATLILAATALIGFEGIRRLSNPSEVKGGLVVAVALVALLANTGAALLLWEKRGDVNMRAALLHMASDAAASFGVAVAGGVILATGRFEWLDPAISLAIGVIIGWQAIKLMGETTSLLLESTPDGLDVDGVTATMLAVPGVENVHDMHVWSLSSEVRALSAHVILEGHPTLEEAQVVGTAVKAAVSGPFSIAHATLELECEGCVDDGTWCSMTDIRSSGTP